MSAEIIVDVEGAVRDRYSEGANNLELALCCPASYDPRYLAAVPKEVLEKRPPHLELAGSWLRFNRSKRPVLWAVLAPTTANCILPSTAPLQF